MNRAICQAADYNIQLSPIIINPDAGSFENVSLFEKLLPVLEEYSHHFGDDFTPRLENYSDWLKLHINFAHNVGPWIFGVIVNSEPQGMIWAYNWESTGYACDIGGFAKRGTLVEATRQAIGQLLELVFQRSQAYVVRGDCAFSNRAARWAMGRAGLSHPEIRRAWRLVSGEEITGIIYSITRPEWEFQHGKQA